MDKLICELEKLRKLRKCIVWFCIFLYVVIVLSQLFLNIDSPICSLMVIANFLFGVISLYIVCHFEKRIKVKLENKLRERWR